MKNNLLMFTGHECPHCDAMRPLVAKLSFETGLSIEERGVWTKENQENYRYMENIRPKDCDGLPVFYNSDNHQALCGEVSYAELHAWATYGLANS